MTYPDGTAILIHDRIRLAGRPGTVVFDLDGDQFTPDYPREEWAYLRQGIMVRIEGAGLVHLQGHDPDLAFVRRDAE